MDLRCKRSSILHPGEMVADYLATYEWTAAELAERSGMSVATINAIVAGTASVDGQAADALERVFGRPAHLWRNLQRRFDNAQGVFSCENA